MVVAICLALPPRLRAVAKPLSSYGIAVRRIQAAIAQSHCLKLGPVLLPGVNAGGGNQRLPLNR